MGRRAARQISSPTFITGRCAAPRLRLQGFAEQTLLAAAIDDFAKSCPLPRHYSRGTSRRTFARLTRTWLPCSSGKWDAEPDSNGEIRRA